MKNILLACFVVAGSFTGTFAQSAKTQAEVGTTVEPKLLLTSKISEMEAANSRNRPDLLPGMFSESLAMMTQRITAVHQEYTAASGANKETLKKKMDKLQALYAEAKTLSAEAKTNGPAFIEKSKAFLQNW